MLDTTVTFSGGAYDTALIDVSAGGAKFCFKMPPPKMPDRGTPISIEIQPFGEFDGEVMWIDDDYAGIKFDENHKATAALINEMVAQGR